MDSNCSIQGSKMSSYLAISHQDIVDQFWPAPRSRISRYWSYPLPAVVVLVVGRCVNATNISCKLTLIAGRVFVCRNIISMMGILFDLIGATLFVLEWGAVNITHQSCEVSSTQLHSFWSGMLIICLTQTVSCTSLTMHYHTNISLPYLTGIMLLSHVSNIW